MGADNGKPKFSAPLDLSRVCISPDAPWDERNDRLVEAVLLSNTQPAPAQEQITKIFEEGVNINARHPEGYTVLRVAEFNVCSHSVVALLTRAGREGTATFDAAATAARTPDPASVVHTLPFEFRGSAREYFRIWAVNLCLTLLTLGVYSAWAKVRKQRYFYSHTWLDGTPFQYLGEPIPILKGRVIAVLLFLLWYFSFNFFADLLPAVLILAAVLAPWVIVRSAAFNARYSAFRNMTFAFDGNYRDGFAAIYFWGIFPVAVVLAVWTWDELPQIAGIVMIVCSFAFPFWLARVKRFLARHTSFGGRHAELKIHGGHLYGIYFIGGLLAIVGVVVTLSLTYAVVAGLMGKEFAERYVVIITMLSFYLSYLFSYGYIRAQSLNLVWNNTELGAMRFQSVLTGPGLSKLYLTNVLGIFVSLGLLIPWAVVRTFKYRAEHLRALLKGDYSGFQGSKSTTVHAAGAEVGEIFDFDVSL